MENIIATRIKVLAEEKGISVSKVLKEVELNPGFVTDLNRKNTAPSVDKIEKIADYFNCSVDYLLGRTEQKKHPIQGENALNGVPTEILEVLEAYDSAAPEVKSGVRRFLGLHDPEVYEAIGEDMAKLISGVVKSNETKSNRKV